MSNRMMKSVLTVSILSAMLSVANAAETDKAQQQENESQPQDAVKLETMVLTAEEQVKQSLGVSIITEEDLDKLPVTNDISEYVRRMPGVNLTGNSATGQRGNNRQIDIRGMGPENTLILIDGKPVNSRNSVRYGWRGERDTRGDSNWVPVNAIESIEVLRGPAAARYGSGAMGGVVNIKTKKVYNELHGSIETYTNQPENSKEGNTNRVSVNLSGPIIQDVLSYRIYGNYNKTDNDAPDINPVVGSNGYRAAGREGVENKDINARLAWKMTDHQHLLFDIGSGRQGNLYAGDSQNSNLDPTTNDILSQLFGKETNTLYRDNYALTHEGEWSWGDSKLIAQFDRTKNKRLPEGTAGASEGRINSLEDRVTSTLDTLRFNGEVTVPFELYVPQNLTIGAEWVEDDFSDQENTKQGDGSYSENLTTGDRSKMKSRIASGYLENNMKITDATDMVVGIRFDDHNRSGSNWSPSLNLSHKLGDYFTLKGGIAKAYKAPNLYQNAEGYLLGTRGNGCPIGLSQCVLQGNANLKPETSINKEIGFEFQKDIVNASLAWFRNDYEDKITSGDEVTQQVVIGDTTYNVLQWTNIPKALIQGLEGSISLDWGDVTWTNNFTYMTDSVNKKTGNPLSVVPNYTINSIFNYDITDAWDVNFVYTQYGRQKPRQYKETSLEDKQGIITESVKSYGLAGINTGYKFNDNFSGRIGISNLFDEQKLRDNTVNQTYNEPGRAYYASLKYEF
ncbi:TonB-dependent siderophore receptor [Acinetobacter radioresistens]|uniref:TonB-dependent siderophore receptor n=1 Tax=Acinetobacter radioresistens TaxID=40216 RepID=UPI000F798144|nr:TonB-dependent siderophore receptor [Acinetobacter radioresistens]MCU4516661.1 TonB-dependent siderophore receptor [Acinetobacter radioresistens]RSO69599.1 TonB-dependent siderophore receptor [Acinetobacter radioresistens]